MPARARAGNGKACCTRVCAHAPGEASALSKSAKVHPQHSQHRVCGNTRQRVTVRRTQPSCVCNEAHVDYIMTIAILCLLALDNQHGFANRLVRTWLARASLSYVSRCCVGWHIAFPAWFQGDTPVQVEHPRHASSVFVMCACLFRQAGVVDTSSDGHTVVLYVIHLRCASTVPLCDPG